VKLEDASAEAIQELVTYLKQAADLSIEQAPGLVQEYLAWCILAHQVGLGLALLGLLVGCVALATASKWMDEDWSPTVMISGGAAFVLGLIFIGYNSWRLFQCAHAPRIYMIEQLARLLK